jgi:hypothetical protein
VGGRYLITIRLVKIKPDKQKCNRRQIKKKEPPSKPEERTYVRYGSLVFPSEERTYVRYGSLVFPSEERTYVRYGSLVFPSEERTYVRLP